MSDLIRIFSKHRQEIKELIGEFLIRLDWILERIEFHTENPDSELMDEIIEEYKKWEAKKNEQ